MTVFAGYFDEKFFSGSFSTFFKIQTYDLQLTLEIVEDLKKYLHNIQFNLCIQNEINLF